MTKDSMRKQLEKRGYKIIKTINGVYWASKGFLSFRAETITGLYRQITGK